MSPLAALVLLLAALAACGGSSRSHPVDERACAAATDCACGVRLSTQECFVGNRAFVDSTRQCPDFCTGIDGQRTIECVNGQCESVHR